MPRIRTIKPELWLSPQVMNLSHGARLLFLGLITQADDAGRGCADVRRLKAAILPGDDCTAAEVAGFLLEVVKQRLAIVYEDPDHGQLYELPTWSDHQSIDRPKPSRYPSSQTNRRRVDDASTKDREGSEGSDRKDLKGSDLTRARQKSGKTVDNSIASPDGQKTVSRKSEIRAAVSEIGTGRSTQA